MYYRPAPRKHSFYWLKLGESCIIPFDLKYKCYNRKKAQLLWNYLYLYGKRSSKKFRSRKHMAGIEVIRIF